MKRPPNFVFSGSWIVSSSAAQVLTALAGLMTNVIYARSLPLGDVGAIALVNSIGTMATVFLDRGAGAWITRNVPAGKSSMVDARVAVLRATIPGVAIGAVLIVVILLSVGQDAVLSQALLLATIPFTISVWFFQAGLSFAQARRATDVRSFSIVLNGLLTLAITAVVLWVGGGVIAAVVASSVAYIGAGAILWFTCARGDTGYSPRLDHAQVMREARPLFGANIVTFAVGVGDIFLATALLTPAGVGQYQIAKKIAQAATLPLIATLPVALGRFAGMATGQRHRLVLKFALAASVMFITVGFTGWIVFPWLIPLTFGTNFGSITGLVLILLIAFEMQFFRDLLTALSNASGRYRRGLVSGTVTAATLIAGSLLAGNAPSPAQFAAVIVLGYGSGVVFHILCGAAFREWAGRMLLALTCGVMLVLVVGFVFAANSR